MNDLSVSFHATPSCEFFTSYKALELSVVKMENSSISKILGQGDMHVVTNTSYKLKLKNGDTF